MSARSPYAVLGVPEGSALAACATALAARVAELGPALVAAHAEDRPDAVERFAALVAAWRALTPDAR